VLFYTKLYDFILKCMKLFNTEEEQELSAMFGISLNDIPQLSQGALPKNALIDVINDILLKNKEL
jgi:hypothetical protein